MYFTFLGKPWGPPYQTFLDPPLVEPRYLKLGYLEHPAISNSNPFPLPLFFSNLLSAISNSPLSQTVFRFF